MGEKLVIVESPAKAKTIEKFLGKGYTVRSSFGHICDLPKSSLGIDIAKGFKPKYIVPADKKKVVSELKALAAKAETVYLASDEDREGEAIAWHLQNQLKLKSENTKRIVFHEITKDAILNAVENPRTVDENLVEAQQARRVLDRIVGFELSPVLWRKVGKGLSAGRVQSVAVRLIVDREREIQRFEAAQFYKVTAIFTLNSKTKLNATLDAKFNTKEEAVRFLELCNSGCRFNVSSVEKKEALRCPAPPFTTSALQQEASRKLGFSVSQTMRIAQKLYESGLITYMRTDSTNLSSLAINTIKQAVVENYGENYSKVRQYHTHAKGAQEAHEAIRPTYAANKTIEGTAPEKKLYELIWKRAVASQMADAKVEKTTVTISSDKFSEKFICEGEQILFDGFLKLYIEGKDDEPEEASASQILPNITKGEELEALEITALQKFTQRPPRYSEASLVKKMEELGIGRPSTYAPTITTITSKRGYVVKDTRAGVEREVVKISLKAPSAVAGKGKIEESVQKEKSGSEKNKLFPMDMGTVVTKYLEDNFGVIMDYGFTAKIEEDFDEIAEGKLQWTKLLEHFYGPFHKDVETQTQEKSHVNSERELGVDPKDGKVISVRLGKFGPLAQKGASDDPNKQFASLHKDQSIETITLEEALKLFELPRLVGTIDGKEVTAAIGRFGAYVKYNGKFYSIGREMDPYTITVEQAQQVMKAKEEAQEKSIIKEFASEDIQIINGRYGPYIKHKGENYKIPRTKGSKAAADLTLEDCKAIIGSTPTTSSKTSKRAKK
ncbi:MAG: type I DNA topoisomerase [Bacteroidales bacterium]|nr:type I DNA topoisomerase [Bacteroidales bacterium]